MYLLECLNFQIQYVEKSEAKFRIRLNNHVKDGTRRYTIITPSMKTTLTQGGGLFWRFQTSASRRRARQSDVTAFD